jgi:hypothetical protein
MNLKRFTPILIAALTLPSCLFAFLLYVLHSVCSLQFRQVLLPGALLIVHSEVLTLVIMAAETH